MSILSDLNMKNAQDLSSIVKKSYDTIPIDIVYLYVNSTTKEWYTDYSKYVKEVDPDRFSFNGEIYFSLLSVQKFMPFIRNVYLIVSGPDQHINLNVYEQDFIKKIKYVYHKDIIPEKYLPTFNSTIIEFFMYNIDGLSEYFIHANDDLIINKNLNKYFFENNNPMITYFENKSMCCEDKELLDSYKKTIYVTELLFTAHFEKPMLYKPIHNFTILKKSSVKTSTELIYYYNLDSVFNNKFRNSHVPDLNSIYLFLNISLLDHKYSIKYIDYNLFIINSSSQDPYIADINNITPENLKRASLLCYNSIITNNDKKLFFNQIKMLVDSWYPIQESSKYYNDIMKELE